MKASILRIESSPHVSSGNRVDKIMLHVVLALLPTTAFAFYAFGWTALVTIAVAVISCVLTEHLLCRRSGKETTIADWSAVITGLLYGLTLPPALPLWMVVVGAVIAIGLTKHLFGGLGYNVFNPALVGRALLQAAFPVPMTTWMAAFGVDRFSHIEASTWTLPFSAPTVDVVTSATPLSAFKFEHEVTAAGDLLLGLTHGSAGETCAVLILLGGAYLAARNMMSWRIPVAVLGTVAALSAIAHGLAPETYPSAGFMLGAGGLMLGAVFMATDMVASPLTPWGTVVYGVIIGVLVVVIRWWGGMPEGVMYAILLGNAISPHIDRIIQPRVYGTRRKKPAAAPKGSP